MRIKSLAKAVLPRLVLDPLSRLYKDRRLTREWDAAVRELTVRTAADPARSIIVFPSDPHGIVGAVGDDAMITATVEHFRAARPDLRVTMFCRSGPPEEIVRSRGYKPLVIPAMAGFPPAMASILGEGGHDSLVILGADVMDGHYNADLTTQMLVTADLAARCGMRVIILGFSFNASPAPELAPRFARLDRRVALNLRDATSLERINGFAPVAARLVADSAFTLRPGQVDGDTTAWIAAEKAAGRRVIGINLHPMLVRHADAATIDRMVARMAAAILAADATAPLSWLLVPHDYRDADGDGDGLCLRLLVTRLAEISQVRSRYFEGTHPAATLKALAGQLDGVVTGRMHLAIAALGMGVPVMCLTYQDKFEGLFRHFDLPQDFLLSPAVFDSETALPVALSRFLTDLPDLTAQVARERPRVLALAEQNFVPLTGDAT